jgi:hypothetical protein
MMQNNIKNIFVGLDTDTESRYINPAFYTDANNIRITPSSDNKQTYAQNMPGNKVLELELGQSWKDGIVVGKCKDYQYGFIYYFICSKDTTGLLEDCIYKVDCNTDKVSTILSSNYLFPNYRTAGLLKTNINPVVSATIYDNKMFWCDGTDTTYSHPPRFLDLNLSSQINAVVGDITDLISVSLLTPIYPLTCNVVTTTDNVINYLGNYSYQFTYRFIYKSGQKSRFAPISLLAVTSYSQIGVYPRYIELAVPTLNTLLSIVSIEYAFRESYDLDFKVFKTVDYATSVPILQFKGDEAYSIVAENEFITEYDNVPLLSTSCQYADTRVFWAYYKQDRYKFNVVSSNGSLLSYSKKINKQCLKLGSQYKYSVDFIDHFGKRTTSYVSGKTPTGQVAIDINGSINTTPQSGLLENVEAQKIELLLTDIPSDIEAIEVRRSKNLTVDRFIQGRIEHAYYKTGTNTNGKPVFIKGPDWTTTNYSNYNYASNKNVTSAGANEIYFDISNWVKSGINYTAASGDKLRVLTTGKDDKKVIKRGLDLPIIRQEGDILVASIETNENINRMCSLRIGNNNLANQAVAMVGDFGGIWWSSDGADYIKATKDNVVGWQDKFTKINFYGCCQYVNMFNGNYGAYNFMVVGDGGIILSVYYNTATKIFNITEVQVYNAETPTYRGITMNTVNGANFFMCVIGDKNGNGNATVKLAYQPYGDTGSYPTLTDRSDNFAIKANATVIKSTVVYHDINISVVGLPVHFLTDSNDYIANISLSSSVITPLGYTYTNVGFLNTTIWSDINETRLFLSFTPIWLDYLDFDRRACKGIYLVGENGLQSVIYSSLDSSTVFGINANQDFTDVVWNQFSGYTEDDRPFIFGVGSSGITFTFPENRGFPRGDTKVDYQCPFTGRLTTCVYSFTDTSLSNNKVFRFAGYDDFSGTFARRTFDVFQFTTNTVETDNDVINYGALIEVYTPAELSSEQIYYEIGYCKEVNNGLLKLVLGDGGSNTVAGFENTKDGDCFVIKKKYYGRLWNHTADTILSMTPNGNTDTSWHKDIGRPNIEDLTITFASNLNETLIPFRNFTSNIIFSNPYIQGTKTNELQTFELLNYKQLPIEYGAICGLQVANNTNEDGTIMLSIHKREIVSIYLGKVQFTDVSGVNTISLSNQILGSYRTTNGSLGSIHTESICNYNSFVYGFDALKGVVWRYGQNGVTRISDIGMRLFFYSLGQNRINDRSKNIYQKVISEYNPYYDEVIFTFMDYDMNHPYTNNSFSIVWSERLNRWISKRDAKSIAGTPVMSHASMYQKMYSAYLGTTGLNNYIKVDKHDDNTVNTSLFYGNTVQSPCNIELVVNGSLDQVKSWLDIRLQTDELWNAELITNELGQQTMVLNEDSELEGINGFWRKLENNYYGPILRDMNTLPAVTNPIFEGNPLKSQTLKIKLVLDQSRLTIKSLSNKIVKLYDSIVKFAISFR